DSDRRFSGSGNGLIAPVISKKGTVFYINADADNSLRAIDKTEGKLLWKGEGGYNPYMASSKGVLYVSARFPGGVHAIDEDDGSVIWRWNLESEDDAIEHNVIVTDDLVFVSTYTSVYAIDIST